MKSITIYRPYEAFNKNVAYDILLGNTYLTTLHNGEEKSIEIPDAYQTATLKAKIQWCGSAKWELKHLNENEKIRVSGNNFLNSKLPLFGALFPLIGLVFFDLEVVPKNLGIAVFILFLFGIIGTLTIGRNKWLNIRME